MTDMFPTKSRLPRATSKNTYQINARNTYVAEDL